jgi:Carbohydrate esterase, sialic acid-specific acetylesterase
MVGSGDLTDLPTTPFDYTQAQQAPFSYDLNSGAVVSAGFEFLRPGVLGNSFGPEISFGKKIDDAQTAPIGIVKVAHNGTSLADDWNPDQPGLGLGLYPRLISQVTSVVAPLGVQGVDYEIAGFMWMQGESDTNALRSAAYKDNLNNLIQNVRTDLGAPQMPVVIGRLSKNANLNNLATVRSAQSEVAKADPFTLAVNLDPLPMKIDLIHFTSDGQFGMGEAFANAILFGAPQEDMDGDGLITDDDLNIIVANWSHSVPTGTGDVDGDGFVGLVDIQSVVDRIVPPPPAIGTGDLTGDGFVGINDLNIILANWNQDVTPFNQLAGDTSGDGFVGLADLSQVLAQWNTSPIDNRPPPPTFNDLDLDSDGVLGDGDMDFLLAQWSFVNEVDPDLPVGSELNPVASDFNADGVVDVEDLRYLLDVVPDSLKLGLADLDADGFVGIADLNLVLGNWNQSVNPGDPFQGDVDGDGFVGINDLNAVLGNWNTGTPPGTGGAVVPEPATGVILMSLLGCWAGSRCRRP